MRAQRVLLTVAVTGILSLSPFCVSAFAQTAGQSPATQTGQKNWKDRAEYDLFDAITKDTNAKTRLEKLNQWKEKYPATDFMEQRRALYLTTYTSLGQVQDALNTAKDILSQDPKDYAALSVEAYYIPITKQQPSPEDLDTVEKAANAILGGAKPANVSDADWAKNKPAAESMAHTDLGWVAMNRKQYDTAESEFKKSLGIDPNSGQVPFWLANVILAEGKPDKYSEALYYYARAAAYTGPNALLPAGQQQVKDILTKYYTKYHGSNEGLDALLNQAKGSANPPANFRIVSVADIEKAKLQKEEAEAKANPALALWKSIKEALTGANGASYFDTSMKGALLPGGVNGIKYFTGKVISMEPAVRPKTVVVGIENGATPDATLKFETALPGKVEPGTQLSFAGVAESYTASPFMVVFNVEKKNLEGWAGTNPAPARRAPARRRKR